MINSQIVVLLIKHIYGISAQNKHFEPIYIFHCV